jgi:hypothetical protein
VRVIECARHAVEIGEQQIPVDQRINRIASRGLLERLQRRARNREQVAPPSAPHDSYCGQCAIALRASRDIKRDVDTTACGYFEMTSQRERRRRAPLELHFATVVTGNGESNETWQCASFQHDHRRFDADNAMRVVECSRRTYTHLPMTECSLNGKRQRLGLASAVLDGDRVHEPCDVCVAAVRCKHGTADDELVDLCRERRQPVECALPYDAFGDDGPRDTVDDDDRLEKRRRRSIEKLRPTRKFHGRARTSVQYSDGVHRAVGGMHAGERNPVVACDLPGNAS